METKLETRINKFTDAAQREWTLKLTVGSLRQIREHLAIDLTDVLEPESVLLDTLSRDVVKVFDIISILISDQMISKGVTAESMGDAVTGDVIAEASAALIEAILDFFPSGKTQLIRRSLALKERQMQRLVKNAIDGLEKITDADIDAAMTKIAKAKVAELEATLGKQSSSQQE